MRSDTVRGLLFLGFLIFVDREIRLLKKTLRTADPDVRATFAEVAREMSEELKARHGDDARE